MVTDWISELDTNWVIASANIVLVVVTAFYVRLNSKLVAGTHELAKETKALVEEARTARRPHVVATLQVLPPKLGELRILNAGASAALQISLRFWPLPSGIIRSWSFPVLSSGESVNFALSPGDPSATIIDFLNQYHSVIVKGSYVDGFGSEFEIDDEINVRHMWQDLREADQLAAARTHEGMQIEALKGISEEIRGK